MPVDITRVAEQMDRIIATREREAVRTLQTYLQEAHRRLQREIRQKYPAALESVASQGRVFREARARALMAELEAALESLRLGNPGTGVPRVMRDAIVLGKQEGPKQVAQLVAQLEKQPGVLGVGAQINFEAVAAQLGNAVERLTRYSDEAIAGVNRAITNGLVRGSGVQQVSRDVKRVIIAPDALKAGERIPAGRSGGLAFRAETIARTELISSLEDAREDAMREADIDMAMWVATEDDRTCPWCAARDGHVYSLDELVIPAHPRCRCVTTPVRREWLEDGTIDTDAVREHERETRRKFQEASPDGRLSTGPTAFEKAAGFQSRPKAVWTPQSGFQ